MGTAFSTTGSDFSSVIYPDGRKVIIKPNGLATITQPNKPDIIMQLSQDQIKQLLGLNIDINQII